MQRARRLGFDPATLPPTPDPDRLPRWVTRREMALIHARYFGPISPRTFEHVDLPRRCVPGGPALYDVREFLRWAEARLEAAPLIRGGKRRGEQAMAA